MKRSSVWDQSVEGCQLSRAMQGTLRRDNAVDKLTVESSYARDAEQRQRCR
jgi:hypothetical protein